MTNYPTRRHQFTSNFTPKKTLSHTDAILCSLFRWYKTGSRTEVIQINRIVLYSIRKIRERNTQAQDLIDI